jgi:hypothetical protein
MTMDETKEQTETQLQVVTDEGSVVLDFDRLIRWFKMTPDNAEYIASLIVKSAADARRQIQ